MRIFQRIHKKLNWSARAYIGLIVGVFAIGYLSSVIYHIYKPLPDGLNVTGKLRHADVEFLVDRTYVNVQGQQQQHMIFNKVLQLIDEANSLIVIDMFLFNKEVGASKQVHEKLTQQLADALLNKKLLAPQVEIKVITDPINSVYGGLLPEHYRVLRQGGIDIIETNLLPLRASNPAWSGLWYLCCQGLGNNSEKGWLPNPVGEGKVTLRSYSNLINFKANHRKTIVVDSNEGWKTLVTSMNPHDGSSRHSNVGLLVKGNTAIDVLKSEQVVAAMSQADIPGIVIGEFEAEKSLPQVQVLTESAIYEASLNLIETAKAKDQIDLAMFYLSERRIVNALMDAKQRGVSVRVLLDPNKDAFGRQKNGIPNRPVAAELHTAGIDVRWCNTQGEQCHSKMMIKRSQTSAELILGSANFTARNLKNYNLETDLRVIGSAHAQVFQDTLHYFDQAWLNKNGEKMSVSYAQYADESKLKYWSYRFFEWSGMSTF